MCVHENLFAGNHMVRLYEKGPPWIQHSVHTNQADIGFQFDTERRRAVIVGFLDNLLKGAPSQAVQN